MLVVGRVVDAGGQDDDAGIVAGPGRERGEHVVQLRGVVVDRLNLAGGEQVRHDAFGDVAVFQHVGNTGWNPQVVFQHVEGAVVVAHQIRAADMCPDVVWCGNADALRTEVDRLGQHLAGHDAVLDDLLVVVKVVDKHVERLHPLLEPGVGLLPFGQRDDARHTIEGPGPVDHVAFGIDSKGNAHQLDGDFGRRLVLAQLTGVEVGKVLAQ